MLEKLVVVKLNGGLGTSMGCKVSWRGGKESIMYSGQKKKCKDR